MPPDSSPEATASSFTNANGSTGSSNSNKRKEPMSGGGGSSSSVGGGGGGAAAADSDELDAALNPARGYPRKRVAVACEVCRLRKTKVCFFLFILILRVVIYCAFLLLRERKGGCFWTWVLCSMLCVCVMCVGVLEHAKHGCTDKGDGQWPLSTARITTTPHTVTNPLILFRSPLQIQKAKTLTE